MTKSRLIDYYKNIVVPTIEEFRQNKCDRRRAMLALIVLFHVKDYANKLFINQKDLFYQNEYFQLLQNCANASKHCVLSENKHRENLIDTVENIQQTDHPSLFDAPFGEGYFYEASLVFINYSDDRDIVSSISVEKVLSEVINLYQKYLPLDN